jgi:uncharacterized protein (DUF433 family)
VLAAAWPFITVDEQGTVRIKDTQTKVIEIIMDHLAHHWDAEEIHRQHSALSLPQIHSALGYYYEHQAEFDRMIDDDLRRADELCQQLGNPALQARLRNPSVR